MLRSPRAVAALLFAIVFAVYAFPGRNGGSADTFPAELIPLTLVAEGNLDFNEFTCPVDTATGRAIAYDATRCQPLPYYLTARNGRVLSVYPIIPGLMNLPAHLVAAVLGVDLVQQRFVIGLITAAAITAGAVAFMSLLLGALGYERSTQLFIAFTFAFGTLAWSSAGIGLWQHGPSLLLLILALLSIVRGKRSDLIWTGFLLGVAVFNRPTNVLIALPLAVHVLRTHRTDRRALIGFAVAGAVPLLLMAIYSQMMLGSITALGQGQHMRFGADPLEGLAGVLVSPARGLFVFSPILLMGLLALPRLLRREAAAAPGAAGKPADPVAARRALLRALLFGTGLVILVHGLWHVWWGGHSFGYRLLTETLPGMLLLLAESWETVIRGSRRLVIASGVLLALSLWANAMGALVTPCGFDTVPNALDQHPERLWDVRDTELVRCTARVLRASPTR